MDRKKFYWGDENVLKLNYVDSCNYVNLLKITEVHT